MDFHGAERDLERYDEWKKTVAKNKEEYKSFKESARDQREYIEVLKMNLEETPGSQKSHYDDTVRSDLLKTDIKRAEELLGSINYQIQKYGVYYEMSKGKKKDMEKMRERAKKTLEEKKEPDRYIKGEWR
ncbi:MAG: hypothetical protein OHK93_004725 [Ramalina farinacea]|uniref:Uncharacterized protein n=1 Tax=Ramalina farinacea TaxID=258253 RepID=A0AA43QX33_9LECA|nr:hypothetical protein [Ramalina farinacea]